MRKILIALFFVGTMLTSSPVWAQGPAAVPPPSNQQAAPVPDQPRPARLEYKPSYLGEQTDIGNPHRTTEEITTWAQQAAAEVLSFGKIDYADRMNGFKKYFVQQGWQLYTAYLKDSKVIDMMSDDGYSVGAIVDEVPEIINQGPSGGAYHWIVRMPITISFFKKDIVTGETKTGSSGKYFLFMDVLRVAEGGGEDGIAITNWRVMDVPKN